MKSGEHYDAHYWRFNMPEELPIYPFCSESVLRREPRRTDWMRHPFLILCGLSSGSLCYIFSNRKIVLQEQEVILIPPGTPYFFESHSTGGCYSKQVLELQGPLLNVLLNQLNLNQICVWKKEIWKDFSSAFNIIHSANEQSELENIPDIAAEAIRILYVCSLRNQQEKKKDNPMLAAACHWIEKNLNIPVDLELLCKNLNISRSSLGRLFRAEKGMSPRQYWCMRRNETAELLLRNTDFSIKEIAFRLGYSSQFHFSNAFSLHYKKSPRQYRKIYCCGDTFTQHST